MTEGLTVAGQAGRLFVDEGDIRWLITEHLAVDLHDDQLPSWLVDEIDLILNPMSCRTVPEAFGCTGEDV